MRKLLTKWFEIFFCQNCKNTLFFKQKNFKKSTNSIENDAKNQNQNIDARFYDVDVDDDDVVVWLILNKSCAKISN